MEHICKHFDWKFIFEIFGLFWKKFMIQKFVPNHLRFQVDKTIHFNMFLPVHRFCPWDSHNPIVDTGHINVYIAPPPLPDNHVYYSQHMPFHLWWSLTIVFYTSYRIPSHHFHSLDLKVGALAPVIVEIFEILDYKDCRSPIPTPSRYTFID